MARSRLRAFGRKETVPACEASPAMEPPSDQQKPRGDICGSTSSSWHATLSHGRSATRRSGAAAHLSPAVAGSDLPALGLRPGPGRTAAPERARGRYLGRHGMGEHHSVPYRRLPPPRPPTPPPPLDVPRDQRPPYVRGPGGRDGLWFLSLEADSLATVVSASTIYGVPYRLADMAVETGEILRYRSRRRGAPTVGHDILVQVGDPCSAPSDLDHWLTGRWRAWTRVACRLATVAVAHQPPPLRTATVLELEQSLLGAEGLPRPAGAPLVQYSPGVDVRLGPPRFARTSKP